MNNGDSVMFLVFLELADATNRNSFRASTIEAESRKRFLCMRVDWASWVFESERIHKRIKFSCGSKYKYNIYESKEIGHRRSIKNKSNSNYLSTQKNKLAEMVYDAKKRILQGSLTVLLLSFRKHTISCINSSQKKNKN